MVLQNQLPDKDDGSLSWEDLRRNVRYLNIETRLGYLSMQKKMLKFIEEALNYYKMMIIQYLIKWMPVILFILLLLIDRKNTAQVIGYISLLLTYTIILVARILYAKRQWHSDPVTSKISKDKNIQKMSDFQSKLEEISNNE